MPPFKKTEIPASIFPGVNGGGEGEDNDAGRRTRRTTPDASTVVFTEDADASSTANPTAVNSLDVQRIAEKEHVILVHFDDNDPENPFNWSRSKKWLTTILLCSMTMMIGLSTTAYSSGIDKMAAELGFSVEAGQAGLTAFNAACAVMPLFIAPLCELTGRRWIYLGAFAGFTIITIGLSFAQNLATVIICRLLSGCFGSIGTILVGGSLNDLWSVSDISVPMSLFTFSAIFSTIFAPAYCGYIDQYLGWRWIQYIHLAASGVVLILEVITLRESRGEAILRSRAKRLRSETGQQNLRAQAELEGDTIGQLFRQSSLRAIKLLGSEPVIVFLGLWIALAWGITFLFLSVISITFADIRGWSEGNAGLPYLALAVGCFFTFAVGLLQDMAYDRNKAKNGFGSPEARLYIAMAGGSMLPVGLMIYSWTGPFVWVHWFGPMFALFLIIVGIYSIFLSVYSYTADAYPAIASSAIAAQGLMRNMLAAVTPLFGSQMFNGMGVQWAGLLLSLVSLAITPLPFILYFKGRTIREKSKNAASNRDLKKEQKQEETKQAEEKPLEA